MTRAARAVSDKARNAADKTAGKAGKATGKVTEKATDATSGGALSGALGTLAGAVANKAVSSVTGKVSQSAQRLTDYAEGRGDGGLMTALTGAKKLAEGKGPVTTALSMGASKVGDTVKKAFGGGSGKKGGGLKLTNIIESIDVGVPVEVAYDQWTRFTDFPSFMKKVENVEQESDEKLTWKAQVLWSHRSWKSTITDQVPDEHIVWRSEGEKGYVDGAVTFHELAPRLTRILVVLEYHPQGFFEHTGNLWRAQGRRVRLELKHFRRHVMTQTLLNPDEVEGWHGTIHDGEVVDDGSDGRSRDRQDSEEPESEEDYGDDYDDYGEDADYDESEEDEEDEEDSEYEDGEEEAEGTDRERPGRRTRGR
ncbi:SRPBCC family protein [Saccharomonospora cyanea]|uniref:Putative integral membrane protein n=1 Tax=Saccharomonospora cyanea NA-134 TaxID=882082 RepID=H5XLQ4_9PSEU|nr:SRPBCC family protein [Saccharomonospora cyanea]EHR60952.1 putative integral membrane protein [Saccharomonospora cyanea NA-134]